MINLENIPVALRHIRVYHAVQQNDVAKRLQVCKSYISELENPKKGKIMRLCLLNSFAELFELSLADIIHLAEYLDACDDGNRLAEKYHYTKTSTKMRKIIRHIIDIKDSH